jgi:hypothetical protein
MGGVLMRIHELCGDCKYFEHDCGIDICSEWCHHKSDKIADEFFDRDEIEECEGYEKG